MPTKPITFKAPPAAAECTHWDFEIRGNSVVGTVGCNLCGQTVPLLEAARALIARLTAISHPWLDPAGAPKSRVVEVKTASGHVFRAKQLPAGHLPGPAMKRGGWFWVATGDAHGEEPPDWDNRICWDCNEEGRPSSPVIGWRELVL